MKFCKGLGIAEQQYPPGAVYFSGYSGTGMWIVIGATLDKLDAHFQLTEVDYSEFFADNGHYSFSLG